MTSGLCPMTSAGGWAVGVIGWLIGGVRRGEGLLLSPDALGVRFRSAIFLSLSFSLTSGLTK